MEERWSTEHVLSLAPDAASQKAAGKLSTPAPWSAAGTDGTALWGECRGSGSTPYRTVIELATPAYRCSCPSRKFPCKHALGLLLLWSGTPEAVAAAEPADWAADWLAARRERAAIPSAQATADPAAARRRAEKRGARVAAGAAELRLRLADRIRHGLADRSTAGPWEEVAARMVDAQAPGLAARVRELDGLPQERLLEEYAMLHLLATAATRIDELPAGLAATVRTRVGYTTDAAEILAGPTVRDRWQVLGSRTAPMGDGGDDRLTTRRVWLRGAKTGRPALLLAFGRPDQAPDLAVPTGHLLEAELAFHPAARPLRAALGTRYGAPEPGPAAPPTGLTVAEAVAGYGTAVADDPWLDAWPTVLAGVVPVRTPEGWQLTDGHHTVPVRPSAVPEPALWRLAAVSTGRPLTVFGEYGHQGFAPVTAWAGDHRPIGLTTA
ncbi:SWIM zinc finger domain-containing protein [Kitasatospora aureofaciens]|uniref:SWIM zinc finger family protein n=1 Tax=Kitasatospora aureofaciens TaxID=1894 RepID=UPI001C48D5E4|nr:SWIM zinc finger family protein [Kitasatospora aureofaciens]MBV6696508.1 SWIM zinc finger domain-containing protein [Kitasatospora aureofaciens]